VDIALWDLRGKALGEPVWRLLGGARERVRCYVTFGLPSFDIDQLAAVAKHSVGQGFSGLKMVVGVIALNDPDRFPNPTEALREDARRLAAVRDAVGDGVEIAVDINCELSAPEALALAHMLKPYDPVFIEEPVPDNDARVMADFKRRAGVQVATGQSLGGLYRFADILAHDAADVIQPNVVNCGGFTGGLRAADMALGFNKPICNGGGATAHNLHLQAGAINGTACEWHPYMSMGATQAVFDGCPQPEGGYLAAPEAPGLGMTPNADALKEFG
jgi:L-rhamnonate dehydratase